MNVDTTPPVVLSCPDNIIVIADSGTKSAEVNWIEPIYSDNSGAVFSVELSIGSSSGERFVEGVHPVKYTATDPSANVNNQCAFKVQVRGEHDKVAVKDILSCRQVEYFVILISFNHIIFF